LDFPPLPRTSPCEFDSCAGNGQTVGSNATDANLNWVNSFPVTAIKYGINTVAPKIFGAANKPEFAVTGPNVGSNLDIQVPFSGTVGAATFAVSAGIPAIAFSGSTGDPTAFNASTPLYSQIYADLATNLTHAVLASGKPYLPAGVYLNVNFPDVAQGKCDAMQDFKFVLSRIVPHVPIIMPDDVKTCDGGSLPSERSVVDNTSGCFVSVSVGNAKTKFDASPENQMAVLNKLKGMLSCLPS
jgi:hypothetical protein